MLRINPDRPLPPGYAYGDYWMDDRTGNSGRWVMRMIDGVCVCAEWDFFADDSEMNFDIAFQKEARSLCP